MQKYPIKMAPANESFSVVSSLLGGGMKIQTQKFVAVLDYGEQMDCKQSVKSDNPELNYNY